MTAILDSHERAGLDPGRHAGKKLGSRVELHPRDAGALMLDDYVHADVEIPAVLPRNAKTAGYGYGMLDNDTYGDCVSAAMYHMQESMRLRWGTTPHPWSAKTALTEYFNINGVPPGPAGGSSDNGTDPSVAMNYWQVTGLPGHKIAGWGWVPQTSPNLRRMIAEFGAAMLCVALCVEQQSQGSDWTAVPGEQCGSWGGHAIDADCYDENGLGIVTWGEFGTADNAFVGSCGEGLWVPLSSASLNAHEIGPMGVDFAQMRADLAALSQGQPERS